MGRGIVYYRDVPAGLIEQDADGYIFTYSDSYLADANLPAISLTLPKRREPYHSDILFPFFFGLLAEGTTKEIQCQELKIDGNDHFARLLKTAGVDTIGSVTVKEVQDEQV